MEIRYAKIALKALQSYDNPTRARIRNKIQALTWTPPAGDIKPLAGENGIFRLRVGKFRIKYEYIEEVGQEKILHIIDIDSRGDIYK